MLPFVSTNDCLYVIRPKLALVWLVCLLSVLSSAWLLLCLNFSWKDLVVYIVLLALDSDCSWVDNIYYLFMTRPWVSNIVFRNVHERIFWGVIFWGSVCPWPLLTLSIGLCWLSLWVSFTTSMEKEMATHSSILAWEIPWTEEPGSYRLSIEMQLWTPEMPLKLFHCLVTLRWTMGSKRLSIQSPDCPLSLDWVKLDLYCLSVLNLDCRDEDCLWEVSGALS